jgi:hypothetical protein
MRGITKITLILSLLLAGGLSLTPAIALADDVDRPGKFKVQKHKDADRHGERHIHKRKVIRVVKPDRHRRPDVYRERRVVVVPQTRHYRGIRVVRPYGYRYPGYGFFYADEDAYKWLAFTAITLAILNNINAEQQRLHEEAQIRATTAAVGETIIWEDGGASGSVTTTRVGTSTSGRLCREFQQTVTIGGRTEQAYGTACLQPDGSWELVQ